MSNSATTTDWENARTPESRQVEQLLRAHFHEVDAYRYNSASLRVRIIDPRFNGLSHEDRDELVEPFLAQLDHETQRDIMNLVLLYPGEPNDSFRASINNEEFEHPAKSML